MPVSRTRYSKDLFPRKFPLKYSLIIFILYLYLFILCVWIFFSRCSSRPPPPQISRVYYRAPLRSSPPPSLVKRDRTPSLGEKTFTLLRELSTHFKNNQSPRPSLIKISRHLLSSTNFPLDADILIIGRGLLAYTLMDTLHTHYRILLISPNSLKVTSYYLPDSTTLLSVPESIAFYQEPIRLLAATVSELSSLATYSGLNLSLIQQAYDKLLSSCIKLESSPAVDKLISEKTQDLNLKVEPLDTFMYRVSTSFPDEKVVKGHLISLEDRTTFLEVKLSTGEVKRCRALIHADEYLSSRNSSSSVNLICPVGVRTMKNTLSSPFSNVVSLSCENRSEYTLSFYHDGQSLYFSLFTLRACLVFSSEEYRLLPIPPLTDLDLLTLLSRLGENLDNGKLEPVFHEPRIGLLPSSTQPILRQSSVWFLGPPFQPASRDPLRDGLILAFVYDTILRNQGLT